MRPAFSVVFLTTLTGAAQGLFLALLLVQLLAGYGALAMPSAGFFSAGAALSVLLAVLGLGASFFHLGHPERAWRAVAMWRTSWLSRECICLPAFTAAVFFYGVAHWFNAPSAATLAIGALGVLLCFALFISTGMIYTCLKFLQEWATPLTTTNFIVLGCASGFTLATACANWGAPDLTRFFAGAAIVLTVLGCATRSAALWRNARLKPKSTLQSATGIKSRPLSQKSRGFTSGSFNLREFSHGQTEATMRVVKLGFIVLAFQLPLILLIAGVLLNVGILFGLAFAVQYVGLIAERWFFFAQANHPQKLYMGTAS
jgi:sulfite dehydrogenase (quinone) subunit SoeC